MKTFPSLEPPAVVSAEVALDRLRASGHHLSKAIASLSAERGASNCVTLPFGTLSLFELADFTRRTSSGTSVRSSVRRNRVRAL